MNWMMLSEVFEFVLPIVNDPDSNSIVPPVEQFAQLTVRPAGLQVAKVSRLHNTICVSIQAAHIKAPSAAPINVLLEGITGPL